MTPFKVLLVTGAVALAASCAVAKSDPGKGDREITVMTRNLFLGTDLKPIFAAQTLPALANAVGAGWTQVQANDFAARAEALADEIARSRPDLVGLQEAMLFRTDTPADGPASQAETVAYDFVRMLVKALADRGLGYKRRRDLHRNRRRAPGRLAAPAGRAAHRPGRGARSGRRAGEGFEPEVGRLLGGVDGQHLRGAAQGSAWVGVGRRQSLEHVVPFRHHPPGGVCGTDPQRSGT